ncbi:uncharacterized protein KY384_002597 [Bacidia gigantensis]|uniref:uncharacterized protein n=1 Tax=Bacidia gigantensis TaxID=2732470 RepID=UPI001D05B3BC|nr:uncharacterized protein KY384_002597 [Bacidia gigantensis]KAG8532720.1 hypothetical protein KY384_002597 [Bacidia gigantensis]
MAHDASEELTKFRQQWQEEVRSRKKTISTHRPQAASAHHRPDRAPSPHLPSYNEEHKSAFEDHKDSSYHDLEDLDDQRRLHIEGGSRPNNSRQPSSALEHYEKAVQREGEGSLGDSLKHYHKAYRLDAGVDSLYKSKHFPQSTSKATTAKPSNASSTVPNNAHHYLDGSSKISTSDLIASFQYSYINGEEPLIEGSPAPPCPISFLPSELWVNLLTHTANSDPASFARLAQVCRRLAFLVAAEDQIWREVCHDRAYGFAAMHYAWALTITGQSLPASFEELDAQLLRLTIERPSVQFPLSSTYPSYKSMFQKRPRIRFNGCYISTVNYIRPGGATASQATWNSPVLIVTYYRYLRFFKDGSCISLLTTTEPGDVVHYLTKENVHSGHANSLPTAVMNNALLGRWKLSGDAYASDPNLHEEGTVHIETEGADVDRPEPKYTYKMMLQMKSSRKAAGATKNNKLVWLGYWSYNKLTDDWAEFGLKNDRAYVWSRVKSYGYDI